MKTRILSYEGAQTGPFARVLAGECQAVLALAPGERVSADLSGRTRLRLFPSGVFFPTVENLLPAQTPFSLDDWERDARTLAARGYGPVKLRLDPRCVPEKDREAVSAFLEPVGPELWEQAEDLLIEGDGGDGPAADRVICVLDAARLGDPELPGFLASRGATHLALTGVTELPADLPLPLWARTLSGAPMKVLR